MKRTANVVETESKEYDNFMEGASAASHLSAEEEVELNTPLFLSVSGRQNSTPGEETSMLIEPPSGRSIHQFTTLQKPKWATIDPDFLLPDPVLRDQTMPVTTSE